jgi:thioredoxin 1
MQTIEEAVLAIENAQAIMVYFFSEACAPCKALRPKLDSFLNEEFTRIEKLYIEGGSAPGITAHFGVFGFPTILFFFEGKEFRRYGKSVSLNQLGSELERVYNLVFEA